MTIFKGLYKAIYNYDPLPENAGEELQLNENDILYLLDDKPSEDEGWWLTKKRMVGADLEEPTGLVPNNYLEDISDEALYKVKALYDYDQLQNVEEELSFKEGDLFDVIDDSDADWLLVKSSTNEFGFIPGNYVEKSNKSSSLVPEGSTSLPISAFAPPPVRADREEIAKQSSATPTSQIDLSQPPPKHKALQDKELPKEPETYSNNDYTQSSSKNEENSSNDYDELPPPKPTRPGQSQSTNSNTYTPHQTEDFMSWNVQEIIDRSKKVKGKLTIGNTVISFISENSPNGKPEEWSIANLVSYDLEKKHLFLDLVSPSASLELHTGTTSNGREIYDRLSEIKGQYSSKSLDQIKNASTISPERKKQLKDKRMANVLIDFIAESSDELTIRTGDKVNVLNDTNSKDWTLVELVDYPGKKGVVPSQFIESVNQLSAIAHSQGSTKKNNGRSRSSSKSNRNNNNNYDDNDDDITGSWKDDSDQNIKSDQHSAKGKKNRSRSNSQYAPAASSSSKSSSKQSNMPNPKKVRSWVDRSATFKVDAELIGASQGKIHLHKSNGVKIAVPAEKLSLQDLEFVERYTGFSLDKYKPKRQQSPPQQQQQLQGQATGSKDRERERRRRIKEKEDREARDREVEELRRARELLEHERAKLREEKERDFARLKELQMSKDLPAPAKPPRPQKTGGDFTSSTSPQKNMPTGRNPNLPYYDWFEFFLGTGVDVNNCQRYTINFEREDITEDILPSVDATLLRSLGLKEGDILRVMKFLDNKFGRIEQQKTGTTLSETPASADINDVNWATKPTMHTKKSVDSIQDLLDLKPESTGVQSSLVPKQPEQQNKTGINVNNLVPLDPFKTGGTNILPMTIVPMITGGMMTMPQTSFMTGGFQPIGRTVTGGMILPVQKTGGGLIPATSFGQPQITGGFMPQTSFGQPQMTGGFVPQTSFGQPQLNQFTGGFQQQQQPQQTSFGQPQLNQFSGNLQQQQSQLNQFTGGFQQQQPQQTSFGQPQLNQFTGGLQQQQQPQITGGYLPQTSFSQPQLTGGFIPQSTFGMTLQKTGGISPMPQTSFGGNPQNAPNLAQMQNNSNMNIYNNSQPQLQQQPTGFGFGNAPAMQPQQTNQQANLNNASASNPFGF
ncbi:hypothetical protein HANVADRAFT_41561 [Hanseniaspora valbyensis NRRL Y-1626]|uniref:Actin cytoskeleton-regulatory complex protein SLA1 n=1 Tax=Hanseniaspora valbyensis NRRL Y-1626 TaxID=766949 RepID=A0A1B7TAJ2_9ASCO|nr:hypothetical protein HANVADRAFT_41561 [Hanseniaspora valbyensis NRRL Y-1626]